MKKLISERGRKTDNVLDRKGIKERVERSKNHHCVGAIAIGNMGRNSGAHILILGFTNVQYHSYSGLRHEKSRHTFIIISVLAESPSTLYTSSSCKDDFLSLTLDDPASQSRSRSQSSTRPNIPRIDLLLPLLHPMRILLFLRQGHCLLDSVP